MPRRFNGTTQYVYPLSSHTGIDLGAGGMFSEVAPYTVMGWVNAAGTVENADWYSEHTFDSNAFFQCRVNDGKALFAARKDGSVGTPELNFVSSSGTVADNTWHHIAFTQDGKGSPTNYNIYIDGKFDSNGTYTGDVTTNTRFRIGNSYTPGGDAAFYAGKIAHVAVWRRQLSPGVIKAIYQGSAITRFNPNHYWPLLGTEMESDYGSVGNYPGRINDGTVAPTGPRATGDAPQRAQRFRPANWFGQMSPVLRGSAVAPVHHNKFRLILL